MAPWALIEKLRKESKNVTLIRHEKRREINSRRVLISIRDWDIQ